MGATGAETNQFLPIVNKYWADDGHVVKVRAGGVRVVDQVHVPHLEVLQADVARDHLNRLAQVAQKDGKPRGLRYDVAVAIKESDAEVQHLVNNGIIGRACQIDLHFISGGDQAMPNDFQSDGIDCSHGVSSSRVISKLPNAVTVR